MEKKLRNALEHMDDEDFKTYEHYSKKIRIPHQRNEKGAGTLYHGALGAKYCHYTTNTLSACTVMEIYFMFNQRKYFVISLSMSVYALLHCNMPEPMRANANPLDQRLNILILIVASIGAGFEQLSADI